MLAGIATAAVGLGLVLMAAFGPGVMSAQVAASAVVAGAVVELAAGARLTRRGGPGMAHVVSGSLALFLVMFVVASALFTSLAAAGAPPIALALGLYCACNAVFRTIDLFVDRPAGRLFEGLDCAVTAVLGGVLLAGWREATVTLVGVAAGAELASGGLALWGSSWAFRRHPEAPAYLGRADRLAQLSPR